MTVYRRLEVSEKDAERKMTCKSDDSSKFDNRFWEVEVFLPQSDHCGSSDVGGLSRKIRLEQKSPQSEPGHFLIIAKKGPLN